MLKPVYDRNIMVAIKYENKLDWYVLDKYMCFMEENENLQFLPETQEIRKEFPTISENNIEAFLKKIKKYKIEIDEIRLAILKAIAAKKELLAFFPLVMIDFDKKVFFSQYPEPIDYEAYLPEGWIEEYVNFREYVEEEKRYWEYKGKDLLKNNNV